MNLVELAEYTAREAHDGQFRRDGVTPYIVHPERVVARLRAQGITDERVLALAWMHDVLEDTEVIVQDLWDGPLECLAHSLCALTKDKRKPYGEYLRTVMTFAETRIVKIADILDNLSDSPTEKQIVKYSRALIYLHGHPITP